MRALSYSKAEASEGSVAVKKACVAGAKTDLLGGGLSTKCFPPSPTQRFPLLSLLLELVNSL